MIQNVRNSPYCWCERKAESMCRTDSLFRLIYSLFRQEKTEVSIKVARLFGRLADSMYKCDGILSVLKFVIFPKRSISLNMGDDKPSQSNITSFSSIIFVKERRHHFTSTSDLHGLVANLTLPRGTVALSEKHMVIGSVTFRTCSRCHHGVV